MAARPGNHGGGCVGGYPHNCAHSANEDAISTRLAGVRPISVSHGTLITVGLIQSLTKGLDSAVEATANLGAKLGGGEEQPATPAQRGESGSLEQLLDEAEAGASKGVLTRYAVPVVRSAFDGGFIVMSDADRLDLTSKGKAVLARLRQSTAA